MYFNPYLDLRLESFLCAVLQREPYLGRLSLPAHSEHAKQEEALA